MGDFSQNNKAGNGNIHRVRDPFQILLGLVGIGVIGFLMFAQYDKNGNGFVILGFVLLLFLLRVGVIWNGVEINYNNGTLSVPGGGISANSVFDYINPIFLLQYFTRKRIQLNAITNMNTSMSSKTDKQGKRTYKNLISIVGKFGGITLTYSNQNKRDEIFSLIREANHMGTPYTRA